MKRVLLSWSSGKDSAWALHVLRQRGDVEVSGLVTTVNEEAGRVAMHAVRTGLLQEQAAAAGLPLDIIPLPHPCSNARYEAAMRDHFRRAREANVAGIAYGDLALADVRAYRERLMADSDLEPVFPIWGLDTGALAREMVAAGLRAKVTCIDPQQMPPHFAGRTFDASFLDEMPEGVDACGENGEFHTFVTQGPMLNRDIPVVVGETVARDGFVFSDLRPARSRENRR